MNCSQCGKPAMYEVQGGALLCLDCYCKLATITNMQMATLERQINAIDTEAAWITGIPLPPRYPERIQQNIQTGPIGIDNSITLNDSQIGYLNTGVINNLNSNIRLFSAINPNLAEKIGTFTNEVIKDDTLDQEQKDEITKLVQQILEEKKNNKPNINLIGSLIQLVSVAVSNVDKIKTLWDSLKTLLQI